MKEERLPMHVTGLLNGWQNTKRIQVGGSSSFSMHISYRELKKRNDIMMSKSFSRGKMKQRTNGLKNWSLNLGGRRVQIHVATSDLTEQWVIFAQGALRKSARELEIEMNEIDKLITVKVKEIQEQRPVFEDSFN